MKNKCFLRAALISALFLLGYVARCQNAVSQACRLDSLYRRIETLRRKTPTPADTAEQSEIINSCRKFFQILALNDTPLTTLAATSAAKSPVSMAKPPTLETLQQHYSSNPLLRVELEQVASWWVAARKAINENIEAALKYFEASRESEAQHSSAQVAAMYYAKQAANFEKDTLNAVAEFRKQGLVFRHSSKALFQQYALVVKETEDTVEVTRRVLRGESDSPGSSPAFREQIEKPFEDFERAKQKARESITGLFQKYTGQLHDATKTPLQQQLNELTILVSKRRADEAVGTVSSLRKFSKGEADSLTQVIAKQTSQFLGDTSKAWQNFSKSKVNIANWQKIIGNLKVKSGHSSELSKKTIKDNTELIITASTISNPPANFSVANVGLPSPSPLLAESGRQRRASTGSLQGDIIAGTADFVAGRFKQEMNAAFFQHFATLLHDTTYAELGVLFPSTARLLTSGIATYGTLVQTLRGTFEQDLRELLFNYGELLRSQKFYKRQLVGKPEVEQAVRYSYLATRTLYYLGHGTHPADLLTYLDKDIKNAFGPQLDPQLLALDNTLAILQVLSGALLKEQPMGRAWLTTKDIELRLSDPRTQRFFAGLVWQRLSRQERPPQAAAKHGQAVADFYKYLLVQTDDGARFQAMLLGFVSLTTQLQNQAQRLQKRTAADTVGTTPLRAADFVPLFQLVQQGLTFVASYTLPASGPGASKGSASANAELFTKLSTALIQGYVAADRGDYGVTISNFLEVVLLTLNSPGHAEAVTTTGALASTQAAQTTLLSLPQIVRYGTFMAALAQAKSTADVQQALEAAALPVGSSSVKRRSFSTLSINAFGGGLGGLERTFKPVGSEASVATPWRATLGFSAPVGLAFSWGWHRDAQPQRVRWMANPNAVRSKRLRRLDQAYRYYSSGGNEQYLTGSAFSLFASVIDLGVPVLLRLNDGQTGAVPRNIDFRHVFAPGIFVIHGFRNTPLSAFAGVQFTPQLRQLADTTGLRGAPAPFLNSLRINAGITIDIPIFTLFNRTESRQPTPGRLVIEHTQHAAAVQLETLHYLRQSALPKERCQQVQAALEARRKQLDALSAAQGLTGKQKARFDDAKAESCQQLDKAQKIVKKYHKEPKLMGSFIKRTRLRRIATHLWRAEQQYVVAQELKQPAQTGRVAGGTPNEKVQPLPAILKEFSNATAP